MTLTKYLPLLPMALIKIIVDYGCLCLDDSEDLDEVYNRLLNRTETFLFEYTKHSGHNRKPMGEQIFRKVKSIDKIYSAINL